MVGHQGEFLYSQSVFIGIELIKEGANNHFDFFTGSWLQDFQFLNQLVLGQHPIVVGIVLLEVVLNLLRSQWRHIRAMLLFTMNLTREC